MVQKPTVNLVRLDLQEKEPENGFVNRTILKPLTAMQKHEIEPINNKTWVNSQNIQSI